MNQVEIGGNREIKSGCNRWKSRDQIGGKDSGASMVNESGCNRESQNEKRVQSESESESEMRVQRVKIGRVNNVIFCGGY